MTLKDKVYALRKNAGYTQKEVAELIGTDRSTYACYETGKTLIPLFKLQLLAIVYNVSMDYFNTADSLKLSDPSDEAETAADAGMSKEERICLARIRLYSALGKTEDLTALTAELERLRSQSEEQSDDA